MGYVNMPVLCHGRTSVYDRYIFPEVEFESRANRVREVLDKYGLDGLLIYSDGLSRSHVCYLTNYYSTLSWGNSLLIFPKNGQAVNVTSLGARDYTHTKEMVPKSVELICSGLSMISNHHIVFDALKYIDEHNLGAKWGGVNLDGLCAPGYDPLFEKYPDIQDLTEEYNAIKSIKTDREMYAMSQAASISEKAVNEFMRLAEADVVEIKLAAEIERVCRKYGVDSVSILTSAGEEDIRLRQPRPRKFKNGDILAVVVNAQFLHYNGVFASTKTIGGESACQAELFTTVKRMWDETIDTLKKTRRAIIGQRDTFCDRRQVGSYTLINGIGVDMVEAPDTPGAEIDLKPGMALNVNLSAEKKGTGGALIGHTFYVTENDLVKINGCGY